MCFDKCIYLYNHYNKSRSKIFPSFHEIVFYNFSTVSPCLAPKKHWPFRHYSFNCYVCLVTQSWLTFATLWTVTRQAPLFMRFSRQEYWHGQPFPSPGDLPNIGIKSRSLAWQVNSYHLSHQEAPLYIMI